MLSARLPSRAQVAHDAARNADGMLLALSQVVCHSRGAAVQLRAAQFLCADILARRGLQALVEPLQSEVCNIKALSPPVEGARCDSQSIRLCVVQHQESQMSLLHGSLSCLLYIFMRHHETHRECVWGPCLDKRRPA